MKPVILANVPIVPIRTREILQWVMAFDIPLNRAVMLVFEDETKIGIEKDVKFRVIPADEAVI